MYSLCDLPQTTQPSSVSPLLLLLFKSESLTIATGQWLAKDTHQTTFRPQCWVFNFYLSIPSTVLHSKQNKKIHPVNHGRGSCQQDSDPLPPRWILSGSLQTQNWCRPLCLSVSVGRLTKATLLRWMLVCRCLVWTFRFYLNNSLQSDIKCLQ